MTESTTQKDVQKLQRAIVDGLEDIKAIDIRVFNTEHLTPLFERVIVASGNSNRQTKAMAASVRDKVREAGFAKPRIEGEENGEWIIVDCGWAVAHVMQPAIRAYYNLEEIWGEKPVRLKTAATKAAAKRKAVLSAAPTDAPPAKRAAKKTVRAATTETDVPAKKATRKTVARKAAPDAEAAPSSAPVKKAARKVAKKASASARKTAVRKTTPGAAADQA